MAETQAGLDEIDQKIFELATGKWLVRVRIGTDEFEYSKVDLPQLRAQRNEYASRLANSADSGYVTAFCFSGGKGL